MVCPGDAAAALAVLVWWASFCVVAWLVVLPFVVVVLGQLSPDFELALVLPVVANFAVVVFVPRVPFAFALLVVVNIVGVGSIEHFLRVWLLLKGVG